MDSVIRRRRLVVTPSLTSAGTRVGLFALSASLIGAAMPGSGVAQASPAPIPMAVHAGRPSTCTGVSGSSLASALGYKGLPSAMSSTQQAESGSISGMSTLCIYGSMTSPATVKNIVIVVYETFTKPVSNAQAVAQIKSGLSKDANPAAKVTYSIGTFDGLGALTGKGSFKEGTVSSTFEFMAAWHGAKACSVVLEKVVPKSNLQGALKLVINNFGM
jgi:hypothetical protein